MPILRNACVEGFINEGYVSIFLNVSKGEMANDKVLAKAFPGKDRDAIVAEILEKGELQVRVLP